MGTPQFAVQSFNKLAQSQHHVVGVVTAPDKPARRGLKVRYSPVKTAALSLEVPLLQPTGLRDPKFLSDLRELQADLFIVVAFRILPEEVFEMPPGGTINLHASLLPKYRGAAPINWAIINGEKETGVTTISLVQSVDAGDLLLQKRAKIAENMTAGELHDQLAKLGADLLLETVNGIEAEQVHPRRQEGEVTRAPKLTKELGQIDWQQENVRIRNLIHGLSPVPGAFSYLQGRQFKFYRSEIVSVPTANASPGAIVSVDPRTGSLVVATGTGSLAITELQAEGKRRMSSRDFLMGHQVQTGARFGKA